MWKELFSTASLLDLPLVVMFAFMAIFVGAVIWTCSRRRTGHYERMAALPLIENGSAEVER